MTPYESYGKSGTSVTLNPATYAASALQQAVIGPVTGRLALDLTVLIGWTIVVFVIVGRALDWGRS